RTSPLRSLVLNGASPASVPREEGFAVARMTLTRGRWTHLGGRLKPFGYLARNRKFESISLQRGVAQTIGPSAAGEPGSAGASATWTRTPSSPPAHPRYRPVPARQTSMPRQRGSPRRRPDHDVTSSWLSLPFCRCLAKLPAGSDQHSKIRGGAEMTTHTTRCV